MEVFMASKVKKDGDSLKLTPEEAESMGVELGRTDRGPLPEILRELPMHEQVAGSLTEDDVAEAFTGEVTEESLEEVEEAVGDNQEDAAEEEGT
jgi:hypothetical protein